MSPGRGASGQSSIAYLCRGSGYGHAVRARPIIEELRNRTDVGAVHLAACGQASDYLRRSDVDFHDLGVPEGKEALPSALAVYKSYLKSLPAVDLVVSDELFMVPPVARMLGLPSVLFSCFLGPDRPWVSNVDVMASAASQILVLDWEELHTRSSLVGSKTRYVGPLVQPFDAVTAVGGPRRDHHVVILGAPRTERDAPARFRHQRHLLGAVLKAWRSRRRKDPGRLIVFLNERDGRRLAALDDFPSGVVWIGDAAPDVIDGYIKSAATVTSTPSSTLVRMVRAGIRPRLVLPMSTQEEQRLAEYLSARGLVDLLQAEDVGFEPVVCDPLSPGGSGERAGLLWADSAEIASICTAAVRGDLG